MADTRFNRWQAYSITQLTFAINLVFGLSVGALGFAVSLLRDISFIPSRCYSILFAASLALLGISTLCEIGTAVSRLLDFRYTRGIAVMLRKAPTAKTLTALRPLPIWARRFAPVLGSTDPFHLGHRRTLGLRVLSLWQSAISAIGLSPYNPIGHAASGAPVIANVMPHEHQHKHQKTNRVTLTQFGSSLNRSSVHWVGRDGGRVRLQRAQPTP